MHRIAATPGGWNPGDEGVIFIEQTPAPLVVLTAADTDIQTLAAVADQLPSDFPALRVTNLLHLQQHLTIDTYAEDVLAHAQVIILRLLGGRAYWPYGLEVVQELVERTQAQLFVLPGDDRPDPDLFSRSTVPLTAVNQVWRYLAEGGVENVTHALQFVADLGLGCQYHPPHPRSVPSIGRYTPPLDDADPTWPQVGILFYRAHYLAGNTAPIDALCQALAERHLQPVPVFVSSLRDPDVQAEVMDQLRPLNHTGAEVVLNTTSFAIHSGQTSCGEVGPPDLWHRLNVPVLQVILSGGTLEQWQTEWQGLSPRDIAMNVALPEVDGRIITRAVSFKAVQTYHPRLETDVVRYEPLRDRTHFVAELAASWVRLRQTPIQQRRIALILANYPSRDGRLANGVGLDTPASCVDMLQALQQAGYGVTHPPANSDELMQRLTAGYTNDPDGQGFRPVQQHLALREYQAYFAGLPLAVQERIHQRWGEPKLLLQEGATPLDTASDSYPIAGIQLGQVFVGIQPARGYDQDPSLNYHAPDLEPPHAYLAFYYWLREQFGAQAIVHVGKHGNLEWLPGKGIALSESCFPEVALGALPHFYPFIVNDPGEGSQAKRRSQAVILDHLTPPMTRAELYGPLLRLEGLIDEYYEAQNLDPSRLNRLRAQIAELLLQEHLQRDLRLGEMTRETPTAVDEIITQLDTYLCELKEAQIRDGLHIFGRCPEGRQLRDLLVAIARHPGQGRLGLTRAIAHDWGWDLDPLSPDVGQAVAPPTQPPPEPLSPELAAKLTACRTVGDGVECLEHYAADLIANCLQAGDSGSDQATTLPSTGAIAQELTWIQTHLIPALRQTPQELTNLLRGLNGDYIPAGPSGAPTRGRPEVLPTGRNFYSVDIRAIPTETAWQVGRLAAEAVIERYTQEQGDYPKTLGLSIWGTSCMRTGGDDIAEALALLGVQPVWDGTARRVVDFEILPLSLLGRPRVDVTLRISGFFRDAFPNLIDLFDQAVQAVAALDEPADQNPLAARVKHETQTWQAAGLTPEQANVRSRYRIFGSKPGAYGAGLQGLIEAQNWINDADLARAYMNWSSYAYTGQGRGQSAPEAFEQRLRQMEIVLHNQDNREHDLLDSDDYYQFQGGLTAAVRTVRGQAPQTYFGDHSRPEHPQVRRLQDEIARVYRSRVVNPKWLAGVMRHGYKGAFEMAATVDYLFAYDATAHCVEDFMYQGIADTYLLDPQVQQFVHQTNPWALRDMAERLLEAHQRGLWQDVNSHTLDQLRMLANEAEGTIETNVFTGA